MPTGQELYIERHTTYRDIKSDAEAARYLAELHGLSYDGLRGTLSKADTLQNRLALSDYIRNHFTPDSSVEKQKKIIKESEVVFESLQAQDKPEFTGVFISDKHNPHYRADAWQLTCEILDDMPDVDYISVQNDWNDNKGFGRWPDERRASEQLFTSDIENTRALEASDYKTLHMVQPNAALLALLGNHDKWWYRHKRTTSPQDAEATILQYMSWLQDHNVLQFTRGLQENAIRLSPGLVWVHGRWASKSPQGNAKNAVRQFARKGVASSVVMGHTHRPSIVEGHSIGLAGIRVVNNGCLCENTADYLPFGEAISWGMGITVCHFNPRTREHEIDEIRYAENGSNLIARYNGKRYKVGLTI